MSDAINPNHYLFPNGVEVIHLSRYLTSNAGQAVQYIARSSRLDGQIKDDPVQDLRKAIRFLEDEVARHEELLNDDTESYVNEPVPVTPEQAAQLGVHVPDHGTGQAIDSPYAYRDGEWQIQILGEYYCKGDGLPPTPEGAGYFVDFVGSDNGPDNPPKDHLAVWSPPAQEYLFAFEYEALVAERPYRWGLGVDRWVVETRGSRYRFGEALPTPPGDAPDRYVVEFDDDDSDPGKCPSDAWPVWDTKTNSKMSLAHYEALFD